MISRPQLTGIDSGTDVLVDLPIKRNVVITDERKAEHASRRRSSHGLLNLINLGTIDQSIEFLGVA